MSVVEELAELLAEDGTYDVYPGYANIDLYIMRHIPGAVPFNRVWVSGDFVIWGESRQYELNHVETGLEDIVLAIICTLTKQGLYSE